MTDSVTLCAFTTDPTDAPLFRLRIEPTPGNGLHVACRVKVDKITTVPKAKIGVRIGRLADEDLVRLNRAVLVFLGVGVRLQKQAMPGFRRVTHRRRQSLRWHLTGWFSVH